MRRQQATKEEIRQLVDIVELIGEHVTLKRSGSNHKGLCPFHAEKTPSFNVRRDMGYWKCFGCGEAGDAFDFVMRQEKLTFPEALERLAQRVGVEVARAPEAARRAGQRELIYRANDAANKRFRRNLKALPEAEMARKYVAERGYDEDAVARYGVGYARNSWDDLCTALRGQGVKAEIAVASGLLIPRPSGAGHYDRFRHRITFPIIDVTGHVLGFGGRTLSADEDAKYINTPETPVFRKGRVLYGLNWAREAISDSGMAVVVEGYTDAIALWRAGIHNSVATLGTSLTDEHVTLLSRYADEVVLAFDADSAGVQAALRAAATFEDAPAEVEIVVLPEGQDPDDLVRAQGVAAFQELLERRQGLVEYQLARVFADVAGEGPEQIVKRMGEAADILMRIRHEGRRVEYLARVLDRYCRDRPQAESVQGAVLSEVSRRMRRRRPAASATRAPAAYRDMHFAAEAIARSADGIPQTCAEVEGQLLAAALQDGDFAAELFGLMQPEELLVEAHRPIGHALVSVMHDCGHADSAAAIAQLDDDAVRRRAISLSMAQVDVAARRDALEEDVGKLRKHAQARGLPELYAATSAAKAAQAGAARDGAKSFEQLQQEIVAALEAGELSPDDELYREYERLVRQFRGSGDVEPYLTEDVRLRLGNRGPTAAG
ncbi:MAG: DNA primase [Armatimonadota bacterium]|jgi:DNA primase